MADNSGAVASVQEPTPKRVKSDDTEKPCDVGIEEKTAEVELPVAYFLFGETTKGPLMETAGPLWNEVHRIVDSTVDLFDASDPPRHVTVYKMEPLIYRGGYFTKNKPKKIPDGLKCEQFKGGKYTKFVMRGSYEQLPEVWGKVFDLIESGQIKSRDDFNVEYYVTDAKKVPEEYS